MHCYEKDPTCTQEYLAAQFAEGAERRRQASLSDDEEEDVPIFHRFGIAAESSEGDSDSDRSVFAPTPLRGKASKKRVEIRCGETKKPEENHHRSPSEKYESVRKSEKEVAEKCDSVRKSEKESASFAALAGVTVRSVRGDSGLSSGDSELSLDDLVLDCPEDETTTTSDDEEDDDEDENEARDCETDDDDGIVFE